MKIIINNKEVIEKEIKDKNGKVKEHEGKIVKNYNFKAFSNSNKESSGYSNWEYYENVIKKDSELYDLPRHEVINSLFYLITGYGTWDLTGGSSDQWGGIGAKNYINGNTISVEFDQYDHGLLAIYLIIKNLEPENFE